MHGLFETLRRELREWTCDDADRLRSWGPGTEVDAAAGFPELLRRVLDLWTPGEDDSATEPSLVLALDPTHQRDEWVAPAVSVACREQAIPVAWHVVKADAPESWVGHYHRLLAQLAPAVHVLCDRGLGCRDLWARIVELGWHPVLRCAPEITFRPTGGDRVPVRQLGGGPGTLWVGTGEAFARKPLPCTLIVLHARDCEDPWVLLTDTPPYRTDAALYACRHWIEQGFRGLKRGGWQWGRTRRTDPVRVARHLPVRNRLWARVWLTPAPGPDRSAGLRCLSPPRPNRPCPDSDRMPAPEPGIADREPKPAGCGAEHGPPTARNRPADRNHPLMRPGNTPVKGGWGLKWGFAGHRRNMARPQSVAGSIQPSNRPIHPAVGASSQESQPAK